MREKIAEYLALGYSEADTAKIVGVTPQTISGYMKDESFKELLKTTAAKPEYQQARMTRKYDDLEEKTLNSLRKIATNELTDVSDLTRILDSVSRNRNRSSTTVSGMVHPTVGITLMFPVGMAPQINLDEGNRVVEIGGKSMRAMSMLAVKGMFSEIEENRKAVTGESKRVEEEQGEDHDQRATA